MYSGGIGNTTDLLLCDHTLEMYNKGVGNTTDLLLCDHTLAFADAARFRITIGASGASTSISLRSSNTGKLCGFTESGSITCNSDIKSCCAVEGGRSTLPVSAWWSYKLQEEGTVPLSANASFIMESWASLLRIPLCHWSEDSPSKEGLHPLHPPWHWSMDSTSKEVLARLITHLTPTQTHHSPLTPTPITLTPLHRYSLLHIPLRHWSVDATSKEVTARLIAHLTPTQTHHSHLTPIPIPPHRDSILRIPLRHWSMDPTSKEVLAGLKSTSGMNETMPSYFKLVPTDRPKRWQTASVIPGTSVFIYSSKVDRYCKPDKKGVKLVCKGRPKEVRHKAKRRDSYMFTYDETLCPAEGEVCS
eukprot:gene26576-18343_t